MKYVCIWLMMILVFILAICGCTSGVRFYVYPHELSADAKSKNDLGAKKEVLAKQDYRVLVVQKSNNGRISPIQHFRPEHTFGSRVHPRIVSYDDPLTLTALIIVENLNDTNGIAIKKQNEIDWRIYWLKDKEVKEIDKTGVVYLPPYEDLPLLEN